MQTLKTCSQMGDILLPSAGANQQASKLATVRLTWI